MFECGILPWHLLSINIVVCFIRVHLAVYKVNGRWGFPMNWSSPGIAVGMLWILG